MKPSKNKHNEPLAIAAGRALRRAGKAARKIARMYGTPVYVEKNGKIIAQRP